MEAWHVAFTPGVRPLHIEVAGETVLRDGIPSRVDPTEIRRRAGEQKKRLFSRLG
jgi:hypothetical protein